MAMSLKDDLPRPRVLVGVLALLVYLNSGVEAWRTGRITELRDDPWSFVYMPWKGLQAHASRQGDDRLYFQYAELMLGRTPDLDFMAKKVMSDHAEARRNIAARIRPGTGWRLPYRDFAVEYPPVAVAAMLVPRLFADTLPGYTLAYGIFMAVLFVACGFIAVRITRRSLPAPDPSLTWRRLALLGVAVGPILTGRFDLVPATLVGAGVLALVGTGIGGAALAGAFFGLGIMAKLYPLLVALPLAAYLLGVGERRRALVFGFATGATALAVALPFLLLCRDAFLHSVFLYGLRPYHFETLVGAVMVLFQGPHIVVPSFGSVNVVTPAWLARAGDLALWAGIFALAALALRVGRQQRDADGRVRARGVVATGFAAVTVVLCLGRVLSPQFLIWLLPLAVVFGRDDRRVFLLAFGTIALTQVFFPAFFDAAASGRPFGLGLLLVRNAGLLALGITATRALALRPAVAPAPAARPASAAPAG